MNDEIVSAPVMRAGELHPISGTEEIPPEVARNSEERALLFAYRATTDYHKRALLLFSNACASEHPRKSPHLILVCGGQMR